MTLDADNRPSPSERRARGRGARCGHGLGHIVAIQADYREVVARLQSSLVV